MVKVFSDPLKISLSSISSTPLLEKIITKLRLTNVLPCEGSSPRNRHTCAPFSCPTWTSCLFLVCVLVHQQRQPNRLYVLLSQGVKERLVLEIVISDACIPPLQNDFKLEVKFVVILIQVHDRQNSERHPHNDWNNCPGAIPMKRWNNLVVALDQSE